MIRNWALAAALLLAGLMPAQMQAQTQENKDYEPVAASFTEFLDGVRAEAIAQGIGGATLDAALTGIEPIQRVIELDRKQPEFTQTFDEYLSKRVSETRVAKGREMMAQHRDLLNRVAAKYGVQPRFIVAIWGMETNYGDYLGSFDVIPALATLAYDGRRSEFFRKQLLHALRILDEGHIGADGMKGSWAGAMGQSQFMPSSFNGYAQDFDGDGKRDIWTNVGDVFASIAHYLAQAGWSDDRTWGREVKLPANFGPTLAELRKEEPPKGCNRAMKLHTGARGLNDWQRIGVRMPDGGDLPERDLPGSVVVMGEDEANPRAFMTYSNYRAILAYNCSNYYAIAVGTLADEVAK